MENSSNFIFTFSSNETTQPPTTEGMIYNTATTPLSQTLKTLIVVLGMLINVFGLVGNTGIVVTICRTKSLRKPYNIFIASMAFNDLILCGPLNIIQVVAIHFRQFPFTWFSQDILCRVHNMAWVQFLIVSLLHITMIAIHRYLLVFHQKRVDYLATKRNIIILVFFLHILSFLLVSAQKLSGEHRFVEAAGSCIAWSSGKEIISVLALVLVILTAIILLFSYISIHLKVAKVRRQVQSEITTGQPCSSGRNNLRKTTAHKKILQCMFVIILLSVCSYLPMIICFGRLVRSLYIPPSLVSATVMLVMVSNAANSVVYCSLDTIFRNAFMDLVTSWFNYIRAQLTTNRVHPVIQ